VDEVVGDELPVAVLLADWRAGTRAYRTVSEEAAGRVIESTASMETRMP
jgi:hypothetical protein